MISFPKKMGYQAKHSHLKKWSRKGQLNNRK